MPTKVNAIMSSDKIEEYSENGHARENLWKRGLIMVGFIVGFGMGQTLVHFITLVQFFILAFGKKPNPGLAEFGGSLGQWLCDVAAYQCMSTDEKPFPWQPWPNSPDTTL